MKRILLIMVVVIAIISAIASNATTYYGPIPFIGPAPEYDCTGSQILCLQINGPLYSSPIFQNEETLVIDLSLLFSWYNI